MTCIGLPRTAILAGDLRRVPPLGRSEQEQLKTLGPNPRRRLRGQAPVDPRQGGRGVRGEGLRDRFVQRLVGCDRHVQERNLSLPPQQGGHPPRHPNDARAEGVLGCGAGRRGTDRSGRSLPRVPCLAARGLLDGPGKACRAHQRHRPPERDAAGRGAAAGAAARGSRSGAARQGQSQRHAGSRDAQAFCHDAVRPRELDIHLGYNPTGSVLPTDWAGHRADRSLPGVRPHPHATPATPARATRRG